MVSKRCRQFTWLLMLSNLFTVNSWDTDDLELFDLVEEVNKNFYEVLDVDQGASSSDIRKAYRKLSLQLHPDKNKEPDAEAKFRQLVGVYEVLKDEEKRKRYHLVLENGLPDWRQPIYYYRRARKMGMFELLGVLCLIFTVGQYIVLWAVYAERKFTVSENYSDKIKRMESKNRKLRGKLEEQIEEEMELVLSGIQKPTLSKLWPIRLILGIISLCKNSPTYIMLLIEHIKRKREEQKIEAAEEEEEDDTEEVVKKVKRKVKQEFPEYSEKMADSPVVYTPIGYDDEDDQNLQVTEKKGAWDDEEMAQLSKLASKFPGGTPGRWEKIANMMGRPVSEVTAKAKTLKGSINITANANLQGGLLKQPKKSQVITDDMISKNIDSPLSADDNSDTQLRKRYKNKPQKSVDRTLLIGNTQPVENSSSKTEDKKNEKGGTISTDSNKLNVGKSSKDGSAKVTLTNGTDATEKLSDDSDGWNKNLQTIFEWGLRQYPKGTDQRWEKIANHIPGKSKEDCIVRFKYLADLVKKKKEQKSQEL